jgi:hypothetical protein
MKTNTKTTIVLAGILAFSLAGCSKSEAPTTKISERTEPPKPPAQQQPTVPPLDQEAVALAEKGFLEMWTQVGDSWFTWFRYTNDSGNIFSHFVQTKTVTHEVTPDRLSEADTLNGLQWKGVVRFDGRAYREYQQVKDSPQVPQWSEWAASQPNLFDGNILPAYIFTKKNGQWTNDYVNIRGYHIFFTKPSEEQIKKMLPQ